MRKLRTKFEPGELESEFVRLATELAAMADRFNVRLKPLADPPGSRFKALKFEAQERVLEKLRTTLKIYNNALGDGLNGLNPQILVWSALKHFKLTVNNDFFDTLQSQHVVEIYDTRGIQLFANFRFFELCSYSLEEIWCMDWRELWIRDPKDVARLEEIIGVVRCSTATGLVRVTDMNHMLVERRSALRYRVNYQLLYIASLRERGSGDQTVGFIVIEDASLVDPKLTGVEEEALLANHSRGDDA